MRRTLWAAIAAAALTPSAYGQLWESLGPNVVNNAQTSTTPATVGGAVRTVLTDPNDNNRLFVGTTNGGVWRTTNGGTSWTPLTDNVGSLSISDLAFDPTDASRNTLVAGFGRFRNSSFGSTGGGNRLGVTVSLDGGNTWTNKSISAGLPDINGVVARNLGAGTGTIVASSFVSSANTNVVNPAEVGIWRSTNGGNTWTHLSGTGALPSSGTHGVFENATNTAQLFTIPTFISAGTYGVYRSNDTGATWSQVDTGNVALNTAISTATNVRVSANGSSAFLGLIGNTGQLASLWRSTNNGDTWTQFGGTLTQTNPGGQGSLHFNVLADPSNSNRAYVIGDATQTSPFNGRIYRVDFSANTMTDLFTNGVNAPHADGRTMAIAQNGDLVIGNDGGIYKMANPGTAPAGGNTWNAINGNLGALEVHRVAFDPVSQMAFGGTQDNGTVRQTTAGLNTAWQLTLGGDGADVAVVRNPNNANQSLRYMSAQNLGIFRRGTYDNAGNQVGLLAAPTLTVNGSGGQSIFTFESNNGSGIQFYGPIATNQADGNRLYIGTRRVYESTDQGATLTNLMDFGSATRVSIIKADGFSGNTAQPLVLYVGTTSVAAGGVNQVWMRPDTGGALTLTNYTGGAVLDLAVQATDWQHLAVADADQVFRSTNAGVSFTDITGNLLTGNAGVVRLFSVETMHFGTKDVYLAGGRDGVYFTTTDALGTWNKFGNGLPTTAILDIDYDANNDVLVVAAMGRGVWRILNFSSNFAPIPEPTTVLAFCAAVLGAGTYWRKRRAAT